MNSSDVDYLKQTDLAVTTDKAMQVGQRNILLFLGYTKQYWVYYSHSSVSTFPVGNIGSLTESLRLN